jgi:hypothetical protein
VCRQRSMAETPAQIVSSPIAVKAISSIPTHDISSGCQEDTMITFPQQELMRIQLIGVASTWKRRHCAGRAKTVMIEPYVEGMSPFEYTHEAGCPEHEDSRPTVLAQ